MKLTDHRKTTGRARIPAIAVCCLAISFASAAAPRDTEREYVPRFAHISTDQGLSNSTVLSIDQDSDGNLWFATFDGVDMYDGYEFISFRNDSRDTASIASSITRTVHVDGKGRVWVGTWSGLSLYDPDLEGFRNFSVGPGNDGVVRSVMALSESRLLVGTDGGLYIFDTTTSRFTRDGLPESLFSLKANALCRNRETVFIGTEGSGIHLFRPEQGTEEKMTLGDGREHVQTMLIQNDTVLWAGTEGEGLFRVRISDRSVKNYRHSKDDGAISSNYVRSLELDSEGRLWIGTFNNLNIYDEASGTFSVHASDPADPESLSERSVRSIFRDSQGGMWLGTYFGGLNYHHPLRSRFITIRQNLARNSLNDNIVSCIVEDTDGTLWIGTNDGGVNHYDPDTGHFSYYRLKGEDQKAELESDDIKAIHISPDGETVYIGAHASGLNILHRSTGRLEHCGVSDDGCPPRDVYAITSWDDDRLLIGSLEGLYTFDTKKRLFTRVGEEAGGTPIPRLRIRCFLKDSKGRLWIGGEDGMQVFLMSEAGLEQGMTERMRRLSGLTFVQDIFEGRDRTIWIATRDGLYGFDPEEQDIRRYTAEDGLPNNTVCGIEEDSEGCLWISTDRGLGRFCPGQGTFRNYNVNDGLQSNQFNVYSHCRTSSGRMYFGGINGITTFMPEGLEDNPYSPQPVISRLLVFNRRVSPGDDTGILDKSISRTETLSLPHYCNSFSLEFSVPNYISGQNNRFAYKLEGYDREWYALSDKRSAQYSNLPHGKYVFLLKSANNDGIWNETPRRLEISILPAWYETILAKILIALAAISFISFIFRVYVDRKTMETKLEMERRDKEHQEEINQMKMRFFINISHELRTPLTLIIAPLQEMVARSSDGWMRKQLQYVERNAKRLLHLVNQLMDYRRAELGVFRLRVCAQDIGQILRENFSYYKKLAASKHLKYTLEDETGGKRLLIDGQYLELILNNLLSNAFKYTDSGSISVRAFEKGKDFVLEVKDTGIGIPVDKQARIFERFYQVEKKHIGSGIGLSLVQRLVELHHGRIEIDSEEGRGSRFIVSIPQDPESYDKSEFGTDDDIPEVHSTNSKDMYILDTDTAHDEDEPGKAEDGEDGAGKSWTVLIVEDDEEIRDYIKAGLERSFKVLTVGNGKEALETMKDNEVDLVITDVIMPVMNGIRLCRQIKQNINTSHVPVIILSARTDVREQLEAFHTGADDYIGKPFSMAVLMNKIRNMQKTRLRMLEHYSKSTEIEPEKITFNIADEELIKQAIIVVESNLDNTEFTINQFASAMNMSRSNLHMKLKAITGESALEFMRKIRFKEACRMLKEGKYSISEISYKVGFSTPSYFATSFKKHFGCLPSEYQKTQK